MIEYNQGYWALAFAVRLNGSVFPKSFCWGAPAALLASGLHYTFHKYPEVRDTLSAGDVGASILSAFTFILGFLIVFRSQQAYSRWWEGGTLLQQVRGEWFNAFSSLLAFCNTDKDKKEDVREFQHRLVRLVSLLYAAALEQVTTIHKPHLEVIKLEGFELDQFAFMQTSHDKCEVVLQWLQKVIVEANGKNVISVAPPILGRVYNQLGNGIVNLNNARKITDFPIPFPLAQMVTVMLIAQFFITIMACATSVESSAWAAFLSFLVVFSFWSINYIAIELEMPFGDDPNDLPLQEMQTDLNKSLMSLMQPAAQSCPAFSYMESHDLLETTGCHLDEYLAELEPETFDHEHLQARQHSECNWNRGSPGKGISKRMRQEQEHIIQREEKQKDRKAGGPGRQGSSEIGHIQGDPNADTQAEETVPPKTEEGAVCPVAAVQPSATLSAQDAKAQDQEPIRIEIPIELAEAPEKSKEPSDGRALPDPKFNWEPLGIMMPSRLVALPESSSCTVVDMHVPRESSVTASPIATSNYSNNTIIGFLPVVGSPVGQSPRAGAPGVTETHECTRWVRLGVGQAPPSTDRRGVRV